jgi:hypothetical protein
MTESFSGDFRISLQPVRLRSLGELIPQVRILFGGLNRSAVGETAISSTSRRPQQLAASTLTSLVACTNALRRAMLQHGYAWR